MTFRQILLLLFCCLAIPVAHAEVASVSVNSDTVSAHDASTKTDIILYAGYSGAVGGCSGSAPTTVCNSCSILDPCAATPVVQCAQRSIHPDMALTVTMAFSGTLPTNSTFVIYLEDSSNPITPVSTPTGITANTSFTVQVKWADICSAAGQGADCTGGGTSYVTTENLYMGLVESGGSTIASGFSQKFTLKLIYASPTDASKLISAPTQSPSSSQSFTDFMVLPGDGKVYVSDIYRGSIGTSGSVLKWSALRVYYGPYTGTPDFCQIDYDGGNYSDLSVSSKTEVKTTLDDNKVTGLTNEQDYMFNIATVDEATVVSGFITPSSLTALPISGAQARYLARPGEVIGLLDDKKCFVATAAFGSTMDPHVKLLREFRNQVLFPNKLGREFVRFYYKYSPPAAQFIAKHEVLRTVVRGFLWPFVLFAELSLKIGFFMTFGLFALTLLSLILSVRHFRRRTV